MFYILTPYKLRLKGNIDLTAATSIIIKVKEPVYKNDSQWTATANKKEVIFDISETEITKTGTYLLQVFTVVDGITRRSNEVQINFSKSSFQ